MKYPGGYQIIDMKGLVVVTDADPVELSKEISKKILEALDSNKPIYLTNLFDEEDNSWSFMLDTNGVQLGDIAVYVMPDGNGDPRIVWDVVVNDYDDPTLTIQKVKL